MENPAQLQKAIHKLIGAHARDLSGALHEHRVKLYPPEARKTLRSFSSTEAAKLIGVNDGYLRHLLLKEKVRSPRSETIIAALTP
nr:plasmid partitioning protein RepA [Agrobacterium fabrum]